MRPPTYVVMFNHFYFIVSGGHVCVGKNDVHCEEGAVQTSESLKTVKPSAESRVNSSEDYKPKIVGIYIAPYVEYIIAVLSVLRCGEAFLPLDPFLPNERILSVASSSNADLIIWSESSFGNSNLDRLDESHWLVKSISCPVLSYSIEENLQESSCSTDLPWPCANEKKRSFCYLMYTSGSSGKPKGVCGTEQELQCCIAFPSNSMLIAYSVNRLTAVPSLIRTILPVLQTRADMHVESSLKLLVLSGETFPFALWEMLSSFNYITKDNNFELIRKYQVIQIIVLAAPVFTVLALLLQSNVM
ncbi:hypothetical protein TSUD_321980 [Trifolium subterraneum]|uniref:AMP-dependent synthetase/ligase domain-containing protein n=1 Tax=Trifolium subterraneum TaxID=3900 RepID=A0A2Z6NXW6_TRISU|nr:hypothetical protein TSUD_321980 [Trifolium subterraneum]